MAFHRSVAKSLAYSDNYSNSNTSSQMSVVNKTMDIDAMGPFQKGVKRSVDIVGSLLGLILLSPIYLIIYIVQKIDGKGPVIYSQERIGLHGKPFMIYKYRTMVVDAEDNGVPQLAQQDDDRLTKVGKFLRVHHFDELPQLWNVLVGDMSFVGYRPERKYFIDMIMKENPDYEKLFCSRPGVTSMATLYNGYTDSMEKMLQRLDMDLDYLKHRSLWLDMKIIAKTVLAVVGWKKF